MAVDLSWNDWTEPTIGEVLELSGHPDGVGYAELFERMAILGDRTAVESEGLELTYTELLRSVAGIAAYLHELGIKRGERIALMARGHALTLASYLGVVASGAILVPVYAELEGAPLLSALRRYGVRAIVVDEPSRAKLAPVQGELPDLEIVIDLFGEQFGAAVHQGGDIATMVEQAPGLADPVMILSTSGTTGEPKGVLQNSVFASAALIGAAKWRLDEAIKVYFCTSFGHGAMPFATSMAAWTGGSVFIAPRFSASGFWDEATKHGCNYVHLLGTMQQMLFNQPAKTIDRANSVRYAGSGGMPPAIWRDFETRFDVRVLELFSATDGGGMALTNAGQYPPGAFRPWSDFEARLVDDSGTNVPDGARGNLEMRPRGGEANVTYFNDPAASSAKRHDGWLAFGDSFTRDTDGNYRFVGRARDLIRRRGVNFAPLSIEEVYERHADIDIACAFAVPSQLGEDEVKLVLVAAPGSEVSADTVCKIADQDLPKHMRPRYIEFLSSVPMTPGTQRVIRRWLQAQWRTPGTWDVEERVYLSGPGATAAPSGATAGPPIIDGDHREE